MKTKLLSTIMAVTLAAGSMPVVSAETTSDNSYLQHRFGTEINVPYTTDGFATEAELGNEANYNSNGKTKTDGTLGKTCLPKRKGEPDYVNGFEKNDQHAFVIDELTGEKISGYNKSTNKFTAPIATYKLGDINGDKNVYAARSGGITVNEKADQISLLMVGGATSSTLENNKFKIGKIQITYEGESRAVEQYYIVGDVNGGEQLTKDMLRIYDTTQNKFVNLDGTQMESIGSKTLQDIQIQCLKEDGKKLNIGSHAAFAHVYRIMKGAYKRGNSVYEVVVDVDKTKTVSKIEVVDGENCGRIDEMGVFNTIDHTDKTVSDNAECLKPAADNKSAVSSDKNAYAGAYIPVKLSGSEDIYYLELTRNGAATLAVTALSETLEERIKAADAKLDAATEYSKELDAEIKALIQEGAKTTDFENYAKFISLKETGIYGKRSADYVSLDYDRNGYATWEEVSNTNNYSKDDTYLAETVKENDVDVKYYLPGNDSILYNRGIGFNNEKWKVAFLTKSKNDKTIKDVAGDNWNEEKLILSTDNTSYKMGNPFDGNNNVLGGDKEKDNVKIDVNKKATKLGLLMTNSYRRGGLSVNPVTINYTDNTKETVYVITGGTFCKVGKQLLTKDSNNKFTDAGKDFENKGEITSAVTTNKGEKVIIANDIAWAPQVSSLSSRRYGHDEGNHTTYLHEAVIDVASDKEIVSVSVDITYGERLTRDENNIFYNNSKVISTDSGASAYIPVKVSGDETEYYVQIVRNSVGVFALTAIGDTLRDRINAKNTELVALLESTDTTVEALKNVKAEIDVLITEGAEKADFEQYTALQTAIEEKTELAITKIKLTDSNGAEQTALTTGTYNVTVTLSKKPASAVLVLGAYESNGKFKNTTIPNTVKENEDGSFAYTGTIIIEDGTATLTAFLFDSLQNIQPLTEALDF